MTSECLDLNISFLDLEISSMGLLIFMNPCYLFFMNPFSLNENIKLQKDQPGIGFLDCHSRDWVFAFT